MKHLKRLSFTEWVNLHFTTLFLLMLTGFVITGSLAGRDSYLLKTPHAPAGLLSWEVCMDNQQRDSILTEWSHSYKKVQVFGKDSTYVVRVSGIQTALKDNDADFGFIFFYVSLLMLMIIRLGSSHEGRRAPVIAAGAALFFGGLALAAGLMDVLENLGTIHLITLYLHHQPLAAWTVGLPAIIKWTLLIIVVGKLVWIAISLGKPKIWLEAVSAALQKLVAYSWRFRAVLIVLLVLFALLFISDQGQDLLVSINSSQTGSSLFLIVTTILALLCWHLPKAVDNAKNLTFRQFWLGPVDFDTTDLPVDKRPGGKVDLARLLGAAGFLIPAFGILQTMSAYHIPYWFNFVSPSLLFLALMAIYTLALQNNWIDSFYKKGDKVRAGRYWFTLGIIILIIAILGFGTDNTNRQPFFLAYLALDLVLLSLLFLITVTLRTCVPQIAGWKIAPWIVFSGLFCLIFFIACNFTSFLRLFIVHDRFYTVPIVFCALAGYLLFFSFLLFTGKKTGISIVTILLLFMVFRAMTTVTTYHYFAVKKEKKYDRQMDSFRHYTLQWLKNRRTEIAAFPAAHNNKPYPVFFVNAYGGGIRATVWTTMVIGTLDSIMRAGTNSTADTKDFQHYAFSYSGASGGTIGLSLLVGARYPHARKPLDDTRLYPDRARKFFGYDFLTSDVVALFGRDVLLSSLGLTGPSDRARLMEKDWERHGGNKGIYMSARLCRIWRDSVGLIPLFFANTYDVQTGYKGISAPVVLDKKDFPGTVLIEQEIKDKRVDLRLVTAAFLSARFPYVSPTGRFNEEHRFTDGGTLENSGGETSLQALTVFRHVLDSLKKGDSVYRHVKLNFLSLPNSVPGMDSLGKVKNIYELLAPPMGIINTGGGNSRKADSINMMLAQDSAYGYFTMRPSAIPIIVQKRTIWPVLPLGWQISDYAILQLQAGAKRDGTDLDKILNEFGIVRKKVKLKK